jgi:Protein of unknown function (DUF1573)
MRMKLFAAISAFLLLILAFAIVHWRFDSIANAVSYFDGNAIRIDNPTRELGTVNCDEEFNVAFNIVNLQREPLKIVGANASCSCVLPPEMPMAIEPFVSTPITFTFTSPPTAMQFEQDIELYFDGPVPAVTLKISGATQ